jgi:hypothetical protein
MNLLSKKPHSKKIKKILYSDQIHIFKKKNSIFLPLFKKNFLDSSYKTTQKSHQAQKNTRNTKETIFPFLISSSWFAANQKKQVAQKILTKKPNHPDKRVLN